jgi:bifunctional DNA-binding transcriptional regulator/antitoxin component of YhaV-PrlF toxin-antitoxin module
VAPDDLARKVRQLSELPTTAAKIRALAAQGYPRADIARALDIRYQHVRNVLTRDEEKMKTTEEATLTDAAIPGKIPVAPDGSAVLPSSISNALGIKGGDVLFVRIQDGEVLLLTRDAVARRVQALVREFVPEGVSLVDELIADRRREVETEAQDV